MQANVEVTDTFSGEANYSWVRRYSVDASSSDTAIIRRAKAAAGWNGIRCTKENYGDMIKLKPSGMCQVMFITFAD
jgi:hypothetical protein